MLAVRWIMGAEFAEMTAKFMKEYQEGESSADAYGGYCFARGALEVAKQARVKEMEHAEYKGAVYEFSRKEMAMTEKGSFVLGRDEKGGVRVLKFQDGKLVGVTGLL